MAKPINTEKQDEFLIALVATRGNIKAACERVGLDRSSFYDWKKKPEFADKLAFFIQRSEDNIVDEITAPLYNAYIWEAQIQQKIRNGEKAKPTMKVETFFNLGFKLLSLTKKGKEMLGITPPEIQQTKDPFSEVFALAMGDPNKQVARNNGIHHIRGKIESNSEQPTNDSDAG